MNLVHSMKTKIRWTHCRDDRYSKHALMNFRCNFITKRRKKKTVGKPCKKNYYGDLVEFSMKRFQSGKIFTGIRVKSH